MSNKITVFPKLNSELYDAINFSYTDTYSTEINSVEIPLHLQKAIDDSKEIVLMDNDDNPWSLKDSNLIVNRTIHFDNVKPLFGEKGIVCKNAEIGIGLRWTSKESRQRNVYEITSFKSDSEIINAKFTIRFAKSFLKNSLTLETIIFVKTIGSPEENETYLGNRQGLVLGELDFVNIRLDGKGSEFPIFEEENNDASNPLWSVNVDWDIPSISPFTDSFQIYLNKNNPNYKYIDRNSETYDPHLMVEIVSSALTILVLKLKEDKNSWDEMDKNIDLEEGSVSHAIYHFKHNLHMNFDNPATIQDSFRRYYEQAGNKNDN